MYGSERRASPSDVTEEAWALLEPLIPPGKPGGRPVEIPRREIVHAMVSVLRSACPWRYLPQDCPRWLTVSASFQQGKRDGTWERVHHALRRELRVAVGKEPEPSAAVLDRPSIKTSPVRGDARGDDGGTNNLGQETASRGGHAGAHHLSHSASCC